MRAIICLFIFLFILSCTHVSAEDKMLTKARVFVPTINQLYDQYWPTYSLRHIPYGQVEQESSWNVRARLHTHREDGYGLGQITVAYYSDGKIRFDNFKNAVAYAALRSWDYKNDPYNPKNQLTFAILQNRDNFRQVSKFFLNDTERTKAMLVSYNAGYGRILKRRQAAITQKHKHDTWTGGLEDVHDRFEEKLLYGRPLYQAVNEYPKKIFKRSEKYLVFYRK